MHVRRGLPPDGERQYIRQPERGNCMKVFISSTYQDLKAHRGVLIETLRKMGDDINVVAMEDFGGDPRSPYEVCQDKVRGVDVYVGIFGWRCGSPEKLSQLSMIEIEYRTALGTAIPTYLYLISEEQLVLPSAVETGSGARRLDRLKKELLSRHVVQRFTTPEDLSRLVVADLAKPLRSEVKVVLAPPSGPVGPEVNPGHPFALSHRWNPVPQGDIYRAELFVDVHEDDSLKRRRLLGSVNRVVYQLHNSFVVPVVVMQNSDECFVIDLSVWGDFWARATLYFSNEKRAPIQLLRYVNVAVPRELDDASLVSMSDGLHGDPDPVARRRSG